MLRKNEIRERDKLKQILISTANFRTFQNFIFSLDE